MTRLIKIFDTTLRDGEQCPGASLNIDQKIEIAKQLAKLNVDIIEAGFAIASEGDFEAIKAISQKVKGPQIASLSRAKKEDIDRSWEAIKYCDRPRIHTFLATSPIHMEKKLRMQPHEVLEQSVKMVKYARTLCPDVEFTPEDASRSEPEFLYKVIAETIEAGASTINITDTVGYILPWEFGKLIEDIISNVPQIKEKNITISAHCHNDLGMAVSNSLAAIKAGANQVECTVNGLGERAGNASLEEIVMAIKTRKNFFDCDTNINTTEIYKTSRLVSNLTGILVQPNKAIVGANAFAHEAGIHQAGIMRARETYEIMRPQDIGLTESKIVLGKHSGRFAIQQKLKDMGHDLDKEALDKVYNRFLEIADKKKEVTERELESIVTEKVHIIPEEFSLVDMSMKCGMSIQPEAHVKLSQKGKMLEASAIGIGPVDAAYKAISELTGIKVDLTSYSLQASAKGTDSMGKVVVRINYLDKIYTGSGTDVDIIVASAKAYLRAINRALNATAQQ